MKGKKEKSYHINVSKSLTDRSKDHCTCMYIVTYIPESYWYGEHSPNLSYIEYNDKGNKIFLIRRI